MSDSSRLHGLVAHQAPLSMGFPWQKYWIGLLFPSPGDLPDPGIEPRSPERSNLQPLRFSNSGVSCDEEFKMRPVFLMTFQCPSFSVGMVSMFWLIVEENNTTIKTLGEELLWWLSGKQSTCQCRRTDVRPLVQEDPTCCRTTKPQRLSLCSIAHELQQLEPMCPRAYSLQWEATAVRSPNTALQSNLCLLQPEKNPCKQQRLTAQPEITKQTNKQTKNPTTLRRTILGVHTLRCELSTHFPICTISLLHGLAGFTKFNLAPAPTSTTHPIFLKATRQWLSKTQSLLLTGSG